MKERIDKILVDRNFAESKSKSQAMILAGDVKVNGEKITKASTTFDLSKDLNIEIIIKVNEEHILALFDWSVWIERFCTNHSEN